MYMHLSITALLATTALAAFKEGCSSAPWDSQEDFFLNKYENTESLPFAPQYNNTYVAIRNRQRRHVVLHCSDEAPPRSVVGEEALIVKVPVQNVAALDGFSQNMIDMLGMSSTIKRTGVYADVTNSCIRGHMRQGRTYDQTGWDEAEDVNVTFHGDTTSQDNQRVLIYSNGGYSPLTQLSYIKFFAMFYGIEEVAEQVYNTVAANYRCAAARVQDLTMNEDYPTGAWLSAFQTNGDELTIFQNDWWNVLASDAGSKLVNVSGDAQQQAESRRNPGRFNLATNQESILSRESWAFIDTTQYDQIENPNLDTSNAERSPRVDATSYGERSGISFNAYAINEKKVYLTDKAENKNRKHNFFDRGFARPDVALHDLISVIKPSFVSEYTTSFLRSIESPDEHVPQRSQDNTCVKEGEALKALEVSQCELPAWAGGYHSSGVSANAYNRNNDEVASLALGGNNSGGLGAGQKAGIATGSILGGLLIIGGIVYAVRRKRTTAPATTQQMEEGKLSPASSISHPRT